MTLPWMDLSSFSPACQCCAESDAPYSEVIDASKGDAFRSEVVLQDHCDVGSREGDTFSGGNLDEALTAEQPSEEDNEPVEDDPVRTEYDVHVQRNDNAARLGVSVRCQRDGNTIGAKVIQVQMDSLIAEWNRTHPENAVNIGDQLIMINGVSVRVASDARSLVSDAQDIHLRFSR